MVKKGTDKSATPPGRAAWCLVLVGLVEPPPLHSWKRPGGGRGCSRVPTQRWHVARETPVGTFGKYDLKTWKKWKLEKLKGMVGWSPPPGGRAPIGFLRFPFSPAACSCLQHQNTQNITRYRMSPPPTSLDPTVLRSGLLCALVERKKLDSCHENAV